VLVNVKLIVLSDDWCTVTVLCAFELRYYEQTLRFELIYLRVSQCSLTMPYSLTFALVALLVF